MCLRLTRLAKLYTERERLCEVQRQTDSDMFHYFSDIEIDRIDEIIKKYKKCGYPLCKYYDPEVKEMICPTPIEGTACQG